MLGVAHGVDGPEVDVVRDAAVWIFFYPLALHDPFKGGLAVDDVFVGGEWDVLEGDILVVNDGGHIIHALAVIILGLAEFHHGDSKRGGASQAACLSIVLGLEVGNLRHGDAGQSGIQMPVCEIATGFCGC